MKVSRLLLFVLLLTCLPPAYAEKLKLDATQQSIFSSFVIVFEDTGDGLLQHDEILYFSGTSGAVPGPGGVPIDANYDSIAYVPDIPGVSSASGTINPDVPCAQCWEFAPSAFNFGWVSDGWFPNRWTYSISPYAEPSRIMNFSYSFDGTDGNAWSPGAVLRGDIRGTVMPDGETVIIDQFGVVTLERPGLPLFVYDEIDGTEFNSYPVANDPAQMSFSGANNRFRSCPEGFDPIFPGDCSFSDSPGGGFLIGPSAGGQILATAADGSGDTVTCNGPPQQRGCRVTDLPFNPANWGLAAGPGSAPFQDEAQFLSSVFNPAQIDFEGLVAPGGFLFLGNPGSYTELGVTITNNSQMFVQNNDLYGTGAFLSPQGANPHIVNFTLPAGTRAIGFSYQSAGGEVLVNGSETFALPAVPFGTLGFFGITNVESIQSLQITIDGPGMDLDNIWFTTNILSVPAVTVPADDCTTTAGGCNPTGFHEFTLPDGFVPPPGATITQYAVPFLDSRADANGRCDGQTPQILFDGDLIIPAHLCGSPEYQVIVTETNFEILEGTIFNTVFPDQFVSNPIDCDIPIVGDPQLQSAFVWQPDDSADVIEGSAIALTNDCGSSRGRVRGFSFVMVGLHIDFGLDFDADPAAVTQAFADLTSTKLNSLVIAVANAQTALSPSEFRVLSVMSELAERLHNERKYQAASRIIRVFLSQTERIQFDTSVGFNHEGNLLSRADHIRFLLEEFIIPFE